VEGPSWWRLGARLPAPILWRENSARLGRFSGAAWDWLVGSRARVT
jgi:hypothetical protein